METETYNELIDMLLKVKPISFSERLEWDYILQSIKEGLIIEKQELLDRLDYFD